jgi:2-desacetyl-2-hydroxyethyl bacteriochlorophyllide A dehydrogenase
MYYYLGKNPYASYPQICGHEISGIVVEAGKGVADITGTAVVIEPFVACGHCYPCRVHKPNCCVNLRIIGVHSAGGYADYVCAPASHVHVIPATLPVSTAALAEPLTIALHALSRGQLQAGEAVLVMGCGPIGMFCIEVAREKGAQVYASDVNPERLEMANELGAITLLANEKLAALSLEHTGGDGFPLVIEATGVPAVMSQTVDLVAAGGRIVIAGLAGKGVNVPFPGLEFTRKELTILGTRTEINCFPEALSLLAEKRIRFAQAATRLDMWDGPRIFQSLADQPGKIHKGLLIRNNHH